MAGSRPFLVVEGKGSRTRVVTARGVSELEADPLETLERLLSKHATPRDGAFLGPGAIGYFSYELGYPLHGLTLHANDDTGIPDLWFAFYDALAVCDHETNETGVRGARVEEPIPSALLRAAAPSRAAAFPSSSFTRGEYDAAFAAAMEHIAAGDIYQVNLCQRFSAPFSSEPWEAYRKLRALHPTALSAFLNTGRSFALSASPELFLRREGGMVETRPIKGTRAKSDPRAAEMLRASEKDRAEHVMIVDLERNDLGKICETGSVSPDEMFAVESCGAVYHLVSTVKGTLGGNSGIGDILRATFPGGSITGAPKKSAMKIIREIEPCVRGIYTGALGWLGFSGDFVLNLPIRTVLIQDGYAHFSVGGGIVADSTAAGEYQETLDKGSAFFKLLGIPGDVPAPV